ncbi:MAG: two component, sigma54 specific, transcriptional regulator, Fis family [Gammaproteobacteria bacterium]|nr:two component, sigma54 specific, transcriptional regulator, Fis family [Gammaproteobacteria bacterium]
MTDLVNRPVVLVLDDEKNIRQSIAIALEQEGLQVIGAQDASSALRALHERIVDLLIIDIQLGDVDGITFFKKVRAEGLDIPAIFISGHATLTEAAQAVKIGGFDFLEKPFSAEKIAITSMRCLEMSAIKERLRLIEMRNDPKDMVGESRAIKQLISEILKVARTHANVLITGESGTGKELVANSIHAQSSRSDGPVIKVNCSAIPDSLLESELFGHEKGAFTGANASKRGLFEVAHRGTIFLDEVADLSLAAQAKILRVLQNGDIQKVGSEKSIQVDVRVLSGTHKDLRQAIAEGRFREDLYYRLNVVPIRVPSLRERADDILLLVSFFANRIYEKHNLKPKAIEEEVVWELQRYAWPGNVRELQKVLERILIMSGDRVSIRDLPEELLAQDDPTDGNRLSALKAFRDNAEREFVIAALKRNNGNVSQSAIELGVGRTYLHRRLAVLKITKRDLFS